MPRFYCPALASWIPRGNDGAIAANSPAFPIRLPLDEAEYRHAKQVLRMRGGEAIELLDGKGLRAQGHVLPWEPHHLNSMWVEISSAQQEPPISPALDIAAALPKGSAADDMLDQLSQLGVTRFIPMRTQRSVVDPRPTKLDRMARNLIESAKQCGRSHVMEVQPVTTIEALLSLHFDPARRLRRIAHPGVGAIEILSRLHDIDRVLVLIGPEGGFTDEEVALAQSHGCQPWSLGPHILRIETAAAAAAAILRSTANSSGP